MVFPEIAQIAIGFWTGQPSGAFDSCLAYVERQATAAFQDAIAPSAGFFDSSFHKCGFCCQGVGKQVLVWAVEETLEKNLLNTLVELDVAVKAMPSANPKLDLLKLFARIDELVKQLPCDSDPILLHYLHKKSYQKARLYLQGRDMENAAGNCRHLN